jgi:hypothetical protein
MKLKRFAQVYWSLHKQGSVDKSNFQLAALLMLMQGQWQEPNYQSKVRIYWKN